MDYQVCIDRTEAIQAFEELRGNQKSAIFALKEGETLKQSDIRVVDFLLAHGKILIGKKQDSIGGLFGYTFGERPDFSDKSIAYILIGGLGEEQRRTFAFVDGLVALVEAFRKDGLTKIRFKARLRNKYNNKLYSKFANPIKEVLEEEDKFMLYETTVDSLAQFLLKYKRQK